MKICVVFTGGTIGSQVDQSGYIATSKEAPFLLLKMYQARSKETVDFFTVKPYEILSENMDGDHMEILVKCLQKEIVKQKYDGIVVTHGTDTLQYTSAMLDYVFPHVDIPIVMVSSNYVLTDERANGLDNFAYGIQFISYARQNQLGGVYVSYVNSGECPRIHQGRMLQSVVSYSDRLESIRDSYFGEFNSVDGTFVLNENQIKNQDPDIELPDINQIHFARRNKDICMIHARVGMDYPQLQENTKVIIHTAYHSGTIGITKSLRNFAMLAKEKEIPFYLVGLSGEGTDYETVKFYKELSIMPLLDRPEIAAYCKAWLLISNEIPLDAHM